MSNLVTNNECVGIGGNVKNVVNNKSIVIGNSTLPSENKHGPYSINIGHNTNRIAGSSSIIIGTQYGTGLSQLPNNCIVFNASGTGTTINPTTTNCCSINPIRSATGPYSLYYNPSTYEMTYGIGISGSSRSQTLNAAGAIDVSGTYPTTYLNSIGTFTISTGTVNLQKKNIYNINSAWAGSWGAALGNGLNTLLPQMTVTHTVIPNAVVTSGTTSAVIGPLGSGQAQSVTYVATVPSTTSTTLNGSVTVSGGNLSTPLTQSATLTLTIPTLTASITANPNQTTVGGSVTVTQRVTNSGSYRADNVVVNGGTNYGTLTPGQYVESQGVIPINSVSTSDTYIGDSIERTVSVSATCDRITTPASASTTYNINPKVTMAVTWSGYFNGYPTFSGTPSLTGQEIVGGTFVPSANQANIFFTWTVPVTGSYTITMLDIDRNSTYSFTLYNSMNGAGVLYFNYFPYMSSNLRGTIVYIMPATYTNTFTQNEIVTIRNSFYCSTSGNGHNETFATAIPCYTKLLQLKIVRN